MARLLISVRSLAEASVALHNGADMIDVKEPSRGSLGMASLETISAISREVPPRIAVSAALGEWTDYGGGSNFGAHANSGARAGAAAGAGFAGRLPRVPEGLSYLKIGLAGAARLDHWREEFGRFCREVCTQAEMFSEPACVAVAYADWVRAGAPRPEEVLDFAAANGFQSFLIDTWRKDGAGLFRWLEPSAVESLTAAARDRGLEVALAGSLRVRDLDAVLAIGPDIVAVRSAACPGHQRQASIDAECVQRLAEALAAAHDVVTT